MNGFVKVFTIMGVVAVLSGCSLLRPYEPPRVQGVLVEPETLSQLQPGLSKDQVRALLGPDFGADPFDPTVWDYVLQTNQRDLQRKYVGHLRLWFDAEGYLVRWKRFDEAKK